MPGTRWAGRGNGISATRTNVLGGLRSDAFPRRSPADGRGAGVARGKPAADTRCLPGCRPQRESQGVTRTAVRPAVRRFARAPKTMGETFPRSHLPGRTKRALPALTPGVDPAVPCGGREKPLARTRFPEPFPGFPFAAMPGFARAGAAVEYGRCVVAPASGRRACTRSVPMAHLPAQRPHAGRPGPGSCRKTDCQFRENKVS